MTIIALLGALSGVLMFFNFPLPFMPPFMSFDLANLFELIGGFMLGPVAALLIILIKVLIKLLLIGTSSMYTGEIQLFLLSVAYVIPAVLIYDRKKSKKSAAVGMAVGCVVCSLVAVVTNLTIIIPFYVNLMGMSMDSIIEMCNAVNPIVKNSATLAIFGIIPFNLIKTGVTSVLTYIVYKKISVILKGFIAKRRKEEKKNAV